MDETFKTLAQNIHGTVVTPDSETYDTARKTLFNKTAKPAVVVQCADADDVATAITFAKEHQLEIAVRSGGHSGAGLSTGDGMVIDLGPMHAVEIIDEANHIVRVGCGAQWGDVAEELASHNLALSSGDTSDVGVGGLTLGGGIGWMVRGHGLTIDNLVAAEMVDAHGQKHRASATENPDLFWGIRGGGGGLGIVTSFEFKAAPCQGIVAGSIIYPAEKREAILTKWAEYMSTAPEELNSTLMLSPGFGPGQTPQVIVIACYAGTDEAAAQAAIQPLRELGDTPVHDDVKPKPYYEMLEKGMDVSAFKIRVRNGFIKAFTPQLIASIAEHFGMPNTPFLQVRSLGGEFNRVDNDATAFAHHGNSALLIMPSFAPITSTDEEANALADKSWAPLKPFSTGAYVNFLTDNRPEGIADAYPVATRDRLYQLKQTYDPNNIFHMNMSVQ